MHPPDGHLIRAPTPDDIGAVAAVVIANELATAAQSTLGADFINEEWSRPDLDLATDAWVVLDGSGEIVAYGQAVCEEPTVVESWGVVHPAQRGSGIGAALFHRIELRATSLLAGVVSGRFRHTLDAADLAGAALLSARGLRPVRHFWHLQIELTAMPAPPPAPPGVEITTINPAEDLAAVQDVLDDALAGHWGYHAEPFERWVETETSSPSYDPTLWLLATQRGMPIGALTGSVGEDRGWIDYLGVREANRGRGLAVALLHRSFATFADRGIRRVLVSVDAQNRTGATRLYERVGMRPVKAWDVWERSAG